MVNGGCGGGSTRRFLVTPGERKVCECLVEGAVPGGYFWYWGGNREVSWYWSQFGKRAIVA